MEYIPVRVSTLRGDQKVDFDAYVKISEKYVLYIRKGDSFEGPRLARLKGKKLKRMYIVPDDEQNYRRYLSKNIEMAYDSTSGKSVETRSEIVQGVQQSNAENVMENTENAQVYSEAKDEVARFVEFLQKEDSAIAHILSLDNPDRAIAHHGVTVSTLATALAIRMGITDKKSMQLLGLGALIHDIEHFHSGLDVARPLSSFGKDELGTYKEHPTLGAKRLQDKKHIDQQVMNIILQHEEFIDGQGFPKGLRESQMDPLAVMVAAANAVDRLITFESVPRADAGRELMIRNVGKYPLEQMKHLAAITSQAQK